MSIETKCDVYWNMQVGGKKNSFFWGGEEWFMKTMGHFKTPGVSIITCKKSYRANPPSLATSLEPCDGVGASNFVGSTSGAEGK